MSTRKFLAYFLPLLAVFLNEAYELFFLDSSPLFLFSFGLKSPVPAIAHILRPFSEMMRNRFPLQFFLLNQLSQQLIFFCSPMCFSVEDIIAMQLFYQFFQSLPISQLRFFISWGQTPRFLLNAMVSLESMELPCKRAQRGIRACSSSMGCWWCQERDSMDQGNSFPLSILFLLQKRNKPDHKTWRGQCSPSCWFWPIASIKYYFGFGEIHISIFIIDTISLLNGAFSLSRGPENAVFNTQWLGGAPDGLRVIFYALRQNMGRYFCL